MRIISLVLVFLCSSIGWAANFDFDGENFDVDIDPSIRSVKLVVQDTARDLQDPSKSKFVISAYINGSTEASGTFYTSPGLLIDNPKEGKEPELTPSHRSKGISQFYPKRLSIDHVSGQFGGRVLGIFEVGGMPYSIFFHNGFAIHGSKGKVDGTPQSKGCLRLKLKTHRGGREINPAKTIYTWVASAIKNTRSAKSVKIRIYDTDSEYVENFRRNKSTANSKSTDMR